MKSALNAKRDEYLALLIASVSIISYLAIWFRT
ncbi:hypothetical protein PANPA_00288 (plasmid) [Pantoea sp. Nvir]